MIDPITNTTIEPPNRWSGCSVHDFRSAFQQQKWDEKCFKNVIDTGNINEVNFSEQNLVYSKLFQQKKLNDSSTFI